MSNPRDEGILEIPLAALLEYCDPTLDDPWGCGRIELEDVLAADRLEADPLVDDARFRSYEYNIGRIAYFLKEGWEDPEIDSQPIAVDIGLEGYTPAYLIADGNHRVAAAKIRGDLTIRVELIGSLAKAEEVFFGGVHPDEHTAAEPVDSNYPTV